MPSKPTIACLPNGPYSLSDAGGAQVTRSSGETFATTGKASLCRCGGSMNKPFCDGTHRKNGFTDANLADPKKNRREAYVGKRITIFDNRAICAHAGHCTDGLAAVFRHRDTPWIEPDAAAVEEIVSVIKKCPSGALSYAIEGIEAALPQRPPMVTVTDHGPYEVAGGIELEGIEFGDGASRQHYTLCRCGASKNKPFCDGTHWEVSFRDP